MKRIYAISGLGADGRLLEKLSLPDAELIVIPWLVPERNENISEYAKRMSSFITEDNPILMGVSFGGMMSLAIASIINTSRVIIISSIKSRNEMPPYLRALSILPKSFIHPSPVLGLFPGIQDHFLGADSKDAKEISKEFRKKADRVFLQWALKQVFIWNNVFVPKNLYHLHGNSDKTFPIKYVHPTHLVQGGNHFMVYNKADEISEIINGILRSEIRNEN